MAPTAAGTFSLSDPPSLTILVGRESENNWEARDRILESLVRFCNETRGSLQYSTGNLGFGASGMDLRASLAGFQSSDPRVVLSNYLKVNYEDILLVLHTPRTQLSVRACQFVAAFAQFLGPTLFDGYGEASFHHLLKLSGSTKKIINNAAGESLRAIVGITSPHRAAASLIQACSDKNVNTRLRAFECLKCFVERSYDDLASSVASINNSYGSVHQRIWDSIAVKVLARGISDANSDIRTCAAAIFFWYQKEFPELALAFSDKLDVSTKKQLSLVLNKLGAPKLSAPSSHVSGLKVIGTIALLKEDRVDPSPEKGKNHRDYPLPSSPIKSRSPSPSTRMALSHHEGLVSTPENFTKHRKSPIKASTSTDSLLSQQRPVSPIKKVRIPSSQSAILEPAVFTADVPMDEIILKPTSPVKADLEMPQSPSAVSNDSFYDVLESEPELNKTIQDDDEDAEVILNVKNAQRHTPQSNIKVDVDDLTIELPKKIHIHSNASSQMLSPSLNQLPRTPTRNSFMLSPPGVSMRNGLNLSNDDSPSTLFDLTAKLHRSADSIMSSPSKDSFATYLNTSPVKHPQKFRSLGLVASTPLRKLYRNASEQNFPETANASLEPSSLFVQFADELAAADPESTEQQEAWHKIWTMATRMGDSDQLDPFTVARILDCPFHPRMIDFSERILQLEPSLLDRCLDRFVLCLECFESGTERGEAIALAAAKSCLNPQLSLSLVQLICQLSSEFRLMFLSLCIRSMTLLDFLEKQMIPSMMAPLLLALNHPRADLRRMAVACFLEARNKLGQDRVLAALNAVGAPELHRRMIEGFMRQF